MAYFCRKKTSLASAAHAHYARGLYTGEILSKLLGGKKRRKIGELIYDNDLTN